MQIVRGIEELARAVDRLKTHGTLAAVPTMGALHAGHLALVEAARAHADHVAATIFVNPMQFAPGEDFDLYPRQEARDADALEAAGCALLWMPSPDDIYPSGFATNVSVSGVSERWEGAHRPGHFDGVATVVAKLLLALRADTALFGEKDYQQLAVIRRMVADLNIHCSIVGLATVRDPDGLALSSRNAYLSAGQRKQAPQLYCNLQLAAESIRSGQDCSSVLQAAEQALLSSGFSRVDYVALVDAATLEPLDEPRGEMRILAAAAIGLTRLIDNIAV